MSPSRGSSCPYLRESPSSGVNHRRSLHRLHDRHHNLHPADRHQGEFRYLFPSLWAWTKILEMLCHLQPWLLYLLCVETLFTLHQGCQTQFHCGPH